MDLLSFIVASAQTMAVLLISCCCRTLPRHRKGTKSSMGWKTSSAQCCTRKTAHLEKLNLKQVVPKLRDLKFCWVSICALLLFAQADQLRVQGARGALGDGREGNGRGGGGSFPSVD